MGVGRGGLCLRVVGRPGFTQWKANVLIDQENVKGLGLLGLLDRDLALCVYAFEAN